MREMIRLAEAVQQLGIPYRNAHRLVLTGILKGEKRGRRWWVLKTSVDDLAHAKHGGLPDHFVAACHVLPACQMPRKMPTGRIGWRS